MSVFSIARKSVKKDSGNGYTEQINSMKSYISKSIAGKKINQFKHTGTAFKMGKFGTELLEFFSSNISINEKEYDFVFTRPDRMSRNKHHTKSFLSDLSRLSKKKKFKVKFHFSQEPENNFVLDPKDENFGISEGAMESIEQGYSASLERSEISSKAYQDLETRKQESKETKEKVWIGMLQHLKNQNDVHRPEGMSDKRFIEQICKYLNHNNFPHFNSYYKGRFMKWYLTMVDDEFTGKYMKCSKCSKTRLVSTNYNDDTFECSDLLGCKCEYQMLDTDNPVNVEEETRDMDVEEEEKYGVKKILESKIQAGIEMLKILWNGNWKNNPTWEPKAIMMEDIPEMVEEFEKDPFYLSNDMRNINL